MKNSMGNRLTSIFPRQGHYAHDPNNLVLYPSADITLERIGDLLHHDFDSFPSP
jgi:putative hydrolase of the HAD superfamily